MRYEYVDIPAEEVFRLFRPHFPELPEDKVMRACEAATAVLNIVMWCELNEAPIGYKEMLKIARRNTNHKGAKLYQATAAATKAANRAFEEQLRL